MDRAHCTNSNSEANDIRVERFVSFALLIFSGVLIKGRGRLYLNNMQRTDGHLVSPFTQYSLD